MKRKFGRLEISPLQNAALTYSLAGLGSGVTEAIIVNPFEHVKVQMQSNRAAQAEAPKTFAVAKEIARQQGYILSLSFHGEFCQKILTSASNVNRAYACPIKD